MRLLLDSHIILWALDNDPALDEKTKSTLINPHNDVAVSAASIWEIYIKRKLNKVTAPDNLTDLVLKSGFSILPITAAHAEKAGDLPLLHNDPFDRMLIAQSQLEDRFLMTRDKQLKQYGVQIAEV